MRLHDPNSCNINFHLQLLDRGSYLPRDGSDTPVVHAHITLKDKNTRTSVTQPAQRKPLAQATSRSGPSTSYTTKMGQGRKTSAKKSEQAAASDAGATSDQELLPSPLNAPTSKRGKLNRSQTEQLSYAQPVLIEGSRSKISKRTSRSDAESLGDPDNDVYSDSGTVLGKLHFIRVGTKTWTTNQRSSRTAIPLKVIVVGEVSKPGMSKATCKPTYRAVDTCLPSM